MTSLFLVIISLLVSVAGITYLCLSDAKRQRAHGSGAVKTSTPTAKAIAWLLVLAPGAVLSGLAEYPALILWLGAFPVVGWWVVLILPAGKGAH